jgi:hypothetical protein
VDPGAPSLALVTTDQHAPAAQLIERYAWRWAIEITFADAKHITGVGEAHNRTCLVDQSAVPKRHESPRALRLNPRWRECWLSRTSRGCARRFVEV